jgi:putative FmdB family regulatory protein
MPIYEHQCIKCGEVEEKILSINHEPQIHCGEAMKKMLSIPALTVFKGSGFFATEYGDQMENLGPKAHKHRLNKEMKDRGLSPNNPVDRAENAPRKI